MEATSKGLFGEQELQEMAEAIAEHEQQLSQLRATVQQLSVEACAQAPAPEGGRMAFARIQLRKLWDAMDTSTMPMITTRAREYGPHRAGDAAQHVIGQLCMMISTRDGEILMRDKFMHQIEEAAFGEAIGTRAPEVIVERVKVTVDALLHHDDEIKGLRAINEHQAKELAEARGVRDRLHVDCDKQHKDAAQLRLDLRKADMQITDLLHRLRQVDGSETRKQLAEQEATINNLRHQVAKRDESISELRGKVEALRRERVAADQETADLVSRNQALCGERDSLQAGIAELARANDELREEHDRAISDRDSLANELQRERTHVGQLQAKGAAFRRTLADAADAYSKALTQYKASAEGQAAAQQDPAPEPSKFRTEF